MFLLSSFFFLWLFGAFNLFDSSYLFVTGFSGVKPGITAGGNWAKVTTGLTPTWFWRLLLILVGIPIYYLAVRWLMVFFVQLMQIGQTSLPDTWRIVLVSYFSAGILMTLSACLNPFSPELILGSGVGSTFEGNAGLLFVPWLVSIHSKPRKQITHSLPFSLSWLILGIVVACTFVLVLGRGIRFPA